MPTLLNGIISDMKLLSTLLLMIFSSLPCFGGEEDKLRKLIDDYVLSVNQLDLELAASIWNQSEDISFIQPRGHQKGWEEVRKNFYLGAMSNFSERDLRVKNVSIRILDENTAWGDFYWDFNAKFKDGKEISTEGRETQVWKKEQGAWRIVHVHYSGMPVTGEREGF